MTTKQAKAKQDRIAEHYHLEWWYGLNCKKCCGVYPRLQTEGNATIKDVFYICEVCGKRTPGQSMPWIAEKEWNRGNVIRS